MNSDSGMDKVSQKSPMNEELWRMGQMIECLESKTKDLVVRLTTVLRPATPPPQAPSPEKQISCILRTQLDQANDKLQEIVAVLAGLIDRLEI